MSRRDTAATRPEHLHRLVSILALELAAATLVAPLDRAAGAEAGDGSTLEALTQVRELRDLQYSVHDGLYAFVVSAFTDEAGGRSNVWAYDPKRDDTRRLTASGASNSDPRWCPARHCLAYLGDAEGSRQIYLLPTGAPGGAPRKLTAAHGGVLAFEWRPESDALAFVANGFEPESEAPGAESESPPFVEVVRATPQRLWRLDSSTGSTRPLTGEPMRIAAFRWVPGSENIVLLGSRDVSGEREDNGLFMLDTHSGVIREILKPDGALVQIDISPDGRYVSFTASRGPEPGHKPFDLMLLSLADGSVRNLSAGPVDREIMGYTWRDARTLVAVAADGFRSQLWRFTTDGGHERLESPPANPDWYLTTAGNAIAMIASTATAPAELWLKAGREGFERRTHFNVKAQRGLSLRPPEIIRYESFDGTTIEAALYEPDADRFDRPYPLVVLAHGGPSRRWADQFEMSLAYLLPQRGYAVLAPNVRGSTGYDYEFLMANRKDFGGGDFRDVLAAADHLVAQGVANPDRLGIAGWSYGGYLAAWAITQTDRFKVAVSGAPVTNWLSEYGTSSAGTNRYDKLLMGPLYEDPRAFLAMSPVAQASRAGTPTLLVCAEADVTDPVGQCSEYYRALMQNDVPVELRVYKGVGHLRSGWSRAQVTDSFRSMLSWIEAHLGSGARPSPSSSRGRP